jgi:hypothetical protein
VLQRISSVIGAVLQGWWDCILAIRAMPIVFGFTIILLAVSSFVYVTLRPILLRAGIPNSAPGIVQEIFEFSVQIPLALAIHRYVLLGQRKQEGALTGGGRYWRFFVPVAAFQVIFAVPRIIPALAGEATATAKILTIALMIPLVIFVLRSMMILPAIAVDAAGATWRNALRDSRGHIWRMIFVILLSKIPFDLAQRTLNFISPSVRRTLPELLIIRMSSEVIWMLATATAATVLSRLYLIYADVLLGDVTRRVE